MDINVPVCIQYVSVCISLVSVSISDVLHIFHVQVCLCLKYCLQCQCAPIEIFFDYCPREGQLEVWWPSTAEIGTKLLYMPSPDPVVYVVPLSHILGRLPLLPAGEFGTIPSSMSHKKDSCFPRGCLGQLQPRRTARIRQPAVLHQHMGHDLAHRLPCGGRTMRPHASGTSWLRIEATCT